MSGRRPGTAAAVTGMSVPFGAPDGPPNVYANVGSSPLPCTQTLKSCVPDAGRVITIGAAPISQLFGEMSGLGGPVRCLGWQSPDNVAAALSRARGLAFPSTWFETAGLVVLEALAHGVPALASRSAPGR